MPAFLKKLLPPEPVNRKTLGVLLVSVVSLLVLHYGQQDFVYVWLRPSLLTIFKGLDTGLVHLLWWAILCILSYVVVPVIFLLSIRERNLKEFGLSSNIDLKQGKGYMLLLLPMLPLVFLASFLPSFQSTYPFWNPDAGSALWPNLLIWELAYAMQFFALEFFFRGFIVHGCKQTLGWYAVPVMMIPYVMIHFPKPLPEALGSIAAGWVLGMLSFHSKSIWYGVLMHIAVAWTMDFLSLYHRGLLG